MAAGNVPAATVLQGLLALYVLQDVARLAEQGARPSPDWIARHGLVPGITNSNRKGVMRLIRRPDCLSCENKLSDGSTGDHIIAVAAGGPAGVENYIPLCGRCNSSKGTRDLLAWWRLRGRPVSLLPPDALCAYARLSFAHHQRLGTLNSPAAAALVQAVEELTRALLDPDQERMLRRRVTWISGGRW